MGKLKGKVMAIYLEYEGIKGNVTAEGYKGMINLKHFGFGVGRQISMKAGSLANREHAVPQFGTVDIEKLEDIATIALFRSSVTGSAGRKVTIHFVRTGGKEVVEFMSYTLENCLISKYLIYDTDLNKRPHEKIQLSFTSVLISQAIRSANNSVKNTLRAGYDLEKAVKL